MHLFFSEGPIIDVGHAHGVSIAFIGCYLQVQLHHLADKFLFVLIVVIMRRVYALRSLAKGPVSVITVYQSLEVLHFNSNSRSSLDSGIQAHGVFSVLGEQLLYQIVSKKVRLRDVKNFKSLLSGYEPTFNAQSLFCNFLPADVLMLLGQVFIVLFLQVPSHSEVPLPLTERPNHSGFIRFRQNLVLGLIIISRVLVRGVLVLKFFKATCQLISERRVLQTAAFLADIFGPV